MLFSMRQVRSSGLVDISTDFVFAISRTIGMTLVIPVRVLFAFRFGIINSVARDLAMICVAVFLRKACRTMRGWCVLQMRSTNFW